MPGKQKECSTCHKQMRSDNLLRHKNVCEGENRTILTSDSKYNYQRKGNDLQLSRFANNIINKNQDSGAFNSTSIGNGKDNTVRNPDKVLTIHEAAKKLKIIPESDDESEGSIVGDEYESEEDDEDMEVDPTNENETVIYEDESDSENITKDELKARLYTSSNVMKVFGLKLVADRALSNIELLQYIRMLKVPKFRDVFHIDELPKKVNDVECGIINLSTHEKMGSHWVCYVKIHKTRIFFDSFGRKTPIQIQKYLKTDKEFKNNTSVIQRNIDIVQRVNTKMCGHLCLFVLTSLMRERFFSYHQVMDQLRCAFEEHYY